MHNTHEINPDGEMFSFKVQLSAQIMLNNISMRKDCTLLLSYKRLLRL